VDAKGTELGVMVEGFTSPSYKTVYSEALNRLIEIVVSTNEVEGVATTYYSNQDCTGDPFISTPFASTPLFTDRVFKVSSNDIYGIVDDPRLIGMQVKSFGVPKNCNSMSTTDMTSMQKVRFIELSWGSASNLRQPLYVVARLAKIRWFALPLFAWRNHSRIEHTVTKEVIVKPT
jgi:hypothetical protein